MQTFVHRFALAAATAGSIVLAVSVAATAQGTGTAANPVPDHPSVPPPLELTDPQRTQIRAALDQVHSDVSFELKTAKSSASAKPAVGDKLPKGVTAHALPQALTYQLPVLREYKYIKFRDQILIVNPVTNEIVEMFPQS